MIKNLNTAFIMATVFGALHDILDEVALAVSVAEPQPMADVYRGADAADAAPPTTPHPYDTDTKWETNSIREQEQYHLAVQERDATRMVRGAAVQAALGSLATMPTDENGFLSRCEAIERFLLSGASNMRTGNAKTVN